REGAEGERPSPCKGGVMPKLSWTLAATMVALAGLLLTPSWASGGSERTSAALQLHAELRGAWKTTDCPADPPAGTTWCFGNEAAGLVPGLGRTSQRFTLFIGAQGVADNFCGFWSSPDLTLAIAGKGEISMTAKNPVCQHENGTYGSMAFTVTGGSGLYAGAT